MTHAQKRLLDFITGYMAKSNGVAPSFSEMMTGVELHSKSGIHRILVALERLGKIRRLPNRTRAIELVEDPKMPDGPEKLSTYELVSEANRRGFVVGHILAGQFHAMIPRLTPLQVD